MFVLLSVTAAFASTGPLPQNAAAKPGTHVITDETGSQITVPIEVRRIVSLAPNLTETVYALGVQDRLVGDTIYCDYPLEAKSKSHVGATLNPSLEAIAALQPDLVLATTAINRPETVSAIQHLGIAVYTTDPHSVEGMLAGIRRLGDVLGATAAGEEIVGHLQAKLDMLHASLAGIAPTRVLFVVWEAPLISIGQDTFIADALRWAGAQSVLDTKQNWPQIGFEEAVRLHPDYLVFASDQEKSDAELLADLRTRPGFRDLDSVKNGHVAIISEAVDRPAPRLIDAIEQLANQLHPDAGRAGQSHNPNTQNGDSNSDSEGISRHVNVR